MFKYVVESTPMDIYSDVQLIKDLCETFGSLAAGIFFLYKVGSGYLISGLSLKMECRRVRIGDDSYVAVSLNTKKDNAGTIQLQDAIILVRDARTGDMIGRPTRFKNIRRLSYDLHKSPLEIDVSKISKSAPFLNFALGDEMQFVGLATLPNDDVFLIEAVVLGKRVVAWTKFFPKWLDRIGNYIQDLQRVHAGQWHASCLLTIETKPHIQ